MDNPQEAALFDNSTKDVSPHRNGVQIAYLWIKERIISGHFNPGEVLPQAVLAKQCQTSRGPVREALRLLQNQGLIEAESNQRARVASFSVEDLAHICASIVINVSAAIACSAQRWSKAELAEIRRLAKALQKLRNSSGKGDEDADAVRLKRQNAHRKLVMAMCVHAGRPAREILDNHFDRIAIFRQMARSTKGISPNYPIIINFDDLYVAIDEADSRHIALEVAKLSANLGQTAMQQMDSLRWSAIIDNALAFAAAALSAENLATQSQMITYPNQRITIIQDGSGVLRWSAEDSNGD